MILYWRNPSDWGLSPLTDASLRIQQAEETMVVEAFANFTIVGFTDTDVNLYIKIFKIDKETAERIVQVQSTNPCDRSTEDWLFLRSMLYCTLTQHEQESDFVEEQLIPHGAPYTLIQAVKEGDDNLINFELLKILNFEKRCVLKHIIQRLGPLLGKHR